MLQGTVHIPGMGNVPKKGVVIGGVLASGVGIYIYFKHKNSAAATTTPAATTGTGSGYGYGYGYGSYANTYGYGYGALALGASGALSGAYGYGGFGYGGFGYGGFPGVGVSVPPTAAPASTNAAWAQEAEAYLSSTGGYNPITVTTALGIYLTGSTLSAAQAQVVEAAIAFEGFPPVSAAGGFPPGLHTATSGGQTGTTPAAPKPGSGKGKETGKRHISGGIQSLNAWAKENKTSVGEITTTTDQNYQSGFMTTANHTKFNQYINGGTSKHMPAGMVFFSTK